MLRYFMCFLFLSAPLQSYSAENEELKYIEILSGEAQSNQALPLVIALHGMGDRPENFARIFQNLAIPARIILVQAPDSWRSGFSWYGGKKKRKSRADYHRQLSSSADRVASLTRSLMLKYPSLRKPIITGFSQGGVLSFILAIRHPEMYGLSIPLGGQLPHHFGPQKEKSYPTKVIALHGEKDQIMRLSRTKKQINLIKSGSISIDIEVFANVGHRIPLQMQQRLHKLITRFSEAR